MESSIIARFSSGVVRRISFTWSSQVLPTSVRTGMPLSSSVRSCWSVSAFDPALRVEPNAASLACLSFRFFASAKNAMSRGFEPG
jgi:hypothetical protein